MTLAIERRKESRLIQKARIEVLLEIDRLESRRCIICREGGGPNASITYYRCGCKAAIEIRKLGSML